jgi:hypothetical protein
MLMCSVLIYTKAIGSNVLSINSTTESVHHDSMINISRFKITCMKIYVFFFSNVDDELHSVPQCTFLDVIWQGLTHPPWKERYDDNLICFVPYLQCLVAISEPLRPAYPTTSTSIFEYRVFPASIPTNLARLASVFMVATWKRGRILAVLEHCPDINHQLWATDGYCSGAVDVFTPNLCMNFNPLASQTCFDVYKPSYNVIV